VEDTPRRKRSPHRDGSMANNAPAVSAPLSDTASEGAAAFTRNLLDNASDPDNGETATLSVANVSYSVDGGSASTTAPAGLSLAGATLTIDPTNAAFDHLAVGEHTTITVSYPVRDAGGATAHQTEPVTIKGPNAAPLAVTDTALVGEDVGATPTRGNVLFNDTEKDTSDTHTVTAVNGST